jgi:hypothetical protein
MAGSLIETIEKIKSEIGVHVTIIKSNPSWAEVEKLYRALGTIEELADQPRSSLVELFGIESADGRDVRVKPGEFFGQDALDAAKKYIKKKGEAISLSEIISALKTGGVTANEDKLRLSLSRSTWDVAKVGDDLYGLVEFYPDLKRGNKGKKPVATTTPEEPSNVIVVEEEATADASTGT